MTAEEIKNLLHQWELYKKDHWWDNTAINVEAVLMKEFAEAYTAQQSDEISELKKSVDLLHEAMVTAEKRGHDKAMEEVAQQSKIPTEIYAAIFNPMIHESGFVTLSLHRTQKGAEMAMEFHKAATIDEDGGLDNCKFWDVVKMKIEV